MSVATAFPVSQSLDTMDLTSINTIRTLAMDGVQAANSGHPGTPMAMAPVAYCLWQKFLRFDPQDPVWPNRDRFVLSMGHASMLLYSLLHLTEVRAVNKDYETLVVVQFGFPQASGLDLPVGDCWHGKEKNTSSRRPRIFRWRSWRIRRNGNQQ
jgi:hypothetical protein